MHVSGGQAVIDVNNDCLAMFNCNVPKGHQCQLRLVGSENGHTATCQNINKNCWVVCSCHQAIAVGIYDPLACSREADVAVKQLTQNNE